MENENKVESNVEVIDAKEQKPKKNILGKIIGWLIVLAIFGGLGYLIYQNGGIPENGFNIGEMIGTETPDSLIDDDFIDISKIDPWDYDVMTKIRAINESAGQTLPIGYSFLYHSDPSISEVVNVDQHIVTTITGITDFSDLIGVAYTSNASRYKGICSTFLLEFNDHVDTKALAESIKEQAQPTEWNCGADEYDVYYQNLTEDNFAITANGRYIFIAIVGDEMLESKKSVVPTAFVRAFERTITEK